MKHNAEVYISYAWGNKTKKGLHRQEVFNDVFNALKDSKFEVIVDFEAIKYKGSISSFMTKLGTARFVVIVVSDQYLKSKSCMFEVTQILQQKNLHSRIFPIILPDVDIYSSHGINAYLQYWQAKINAIENEITSMANKSYAKPIYEELDLFHEIRRILTDFTTAIADMNTMKLSMHQKTNYNEIVAAIKSELTSSSEMSKEEALALLQLPTQCMPSQVNAKYTNLLYESQKGLATSSIEVVVEAHTLAIEKLGIAHEIALTLSQEYLRQQKLKILGLIRAKHWYEGIALCKNVLEAEPKETQVLQYLRKCERNKQNEAGTEIRKKDPEDSKEKEQANKEVTETITNNKGGRRANSSPSNSSKKMVSPNKMRNNMQMPIETRREKYQKIKKLILPTTMAILAIIVGFITKEYILSKHVEEVIAEANKNIYDGEINSAIRLLSDESRELIYEDRLSKKLEESKALENEVNDLLLKIRAYKKKSNWKMAERSYEKILVYSPNDEYVQDQLKDVREQLVFTDYDLWMITGRESLKQGEAGLSKALQAFKKALDLGCGNKKAQEQIDIVSVKIQKAQGEYIRKGDVFANADGGLNLAISNYEKALSLTPDDETVLKKIESCKAKRKSN